MTDSITHLPLAHLYLHPLNPRKHHDPAEIQAKADSIRVAGLFQNLVGFRDPAREGVGIVAGGYRLLGLQSLAETHPELTGLFASVPVRITEDAQIAEVWAVAENVSHAPLTPADEIRAYGAMARDSGAPPSTIATAFCVTEAHVRRRLKLADLPEPALDALAAGEISLGVAQALTTAQRPEAAVSVLEQCRCQNWSDGRVRAALHEGKVRANDRRAVFVGLDTYEAAGGTVTRDLFADNAWLDDEKLLDELFADKLSAKAREIEAEGWAFVWTTKERSRWEDNRVRDFDPIEPDPVELPEADMAELEALYEIYNYDLTPEQRARRDELEARAHGSYTDEQIAECGVMIYVSHDGELLRFEGLRPRKPASAASHDDDSKTDTAAATAEPPAMSEALRMDLAAVALCARQTAMLGRTELALDLLAYQLTTGGGYGRIFALSPGSPSSTPGVADGLTISERLATPPYEAMNASGFAAFQAMGKKHRNEVLTQALARLVDTSTSHLAATINTATAVDVRGVWTPTYTNFFSRVKGPYLDALIGEVLHDADEDRLTAFAGLKVKDKARELADLFTSADTREAWGLSREQTARLDTWLPPEIHGAAAMLVPGDEEAA